MKSKKTILVYLLFLTLPAFAQQADMSLIPYRKGDQWGYASLEKKLVISPVYDEANFFYEGYACVMKGKKYGYINKAGRLVIPLKFTNARSFCFGYRDNGKGKKQDTVLFAAASTEASGYEICIDTKGNRMTKCPAISENSVQDSTRPVSENEIEPVYGTLVKSETFDKVMAQYKLPGGEDDFYIAVKNGQYGVINNKFEKIVPFQYSSIVKLVVNKSVYLFAEMNGRKGILNGDGSVFIPVENSRLHYIIGNNGKDYLILTNNGFTELKVFGSSDPLASKYADIQYDREGGFVLTAPNELKGCFFLNNHRLEAKYTDVKFVNNGGFVLTRTQAGKNGYISNQGLEFFEE